MAATVKGPQYLLVGPRQGVYCRPPAVLNTWSSQRSYPPHASAAPDRIRWRVSQFRSPDYDYRLRERVEQLAPEHMPTLPLPQQIRGQIIKGPHPPSTREPRPPGRLQASRSTTNLSCTSLTRHSKLSRSTSQLNAEGAQKSSTAPFSVQACAVTIQSRPPQRSVARKRLAPPTEPFPYPDPAQLSGDQAFNVRLAELAKLERDTVKYEELRARLAGRTVPTLPASSQRSENPARPSSSRGNTASSQRSENPARPSSSRGSTASSQRSENPARPSSSRGNRSSPARAAGRRTSVPVHDRLSRSVNGSLTNRRSSMPSSVGSKSSTTAQQDRHSHHNSLNIAAEESCNQRSPSPSCAITGSQDGSKFSVAEDCTDSVPQRVEEEMNREARGGVGEWKVIANINNHPVEVTLSEGHGQSDSRENGRSKNTSTSALVSAGSTGGGLEREMQLTEKTTEPVFVGEKGGEVKGEVRTQRAGGGEGEEDGPADDCGEDGSPSLTDSASPNTTVSLPVNTKRKHSTTIPSQGTTSHKPASQSAVSSGPRQATPPTDGSSHSSTSSSSLASEPSDRSAHPPPRRGKSRQSPTKSGRSKKHSSKSGRLKREIHQ